jgi:cytochrome P450
VHESVTFPFRRIKSRLTGDREAQEARKVHYSILDRLIADALRHDRQATFASEASKVFSAEILRRELSALLVAGFITTAPASVWMLYEVARNPGLQQRLAESDEADREIQLGAVVKETLRLYPSLFHEGRSAREDFMLGSTKVRRNDLLVVPIHTFHRDPRFWSDPEKFEPQRFVSKSEPSNPAAYMPFLHGPRSCLGRRLAELELRIVLREATQRWKMRVASSPRLTPTFTLRPSQFALELATR